jgi:hypothetical protein
MKKIIITLLCGILLFCCCKRKYPNSESVDCGAYENKADQLLQGIWNLSITDRSGQPLNIGNFSSDNKLTFSEDSVFLYKNNAIAERGYYSVSGSCGYYVNIYLPSFGSNGVLSLRSTPSKNEINGSATVNNSSAYFDMTK